MTGVTANNIGNHGTMAAVGGKKAKPFCDVCLLPNTGEGPTKCQFKQEVKNPAILQEAAN